MFNTTNILAKYGPLGVLAAVIIGGGYVQGQKSDRWAEVPAVEKFAAQFPRLPMNIGDWKGTPEEEPSEQVLKAAGAAGSLTRSYRNSKGDQVSIFLVCGKMRDMLWHTPDRCYPAAGFTAVGEPELTDVRIAGEKTIESADQEDAGQQGGADQRETSFMTATFNKTLPTENQRVRVYWAWCGSGGWQAPRDPRSEFAGEKAIYKLYIVAPAAEGDSTTPNSNSNAAAEFASVLVPELDKAFAPAVQDL